MNCLLEKCNVLKLQERVNLFCVQFIYKILFLNINVPYLENLFLIKECEKSSKTKGMLIVRNAENSTFSRSILIRLRALWNNLSLELRTNNTSYENFKMNVCKFYLEGRDIN